MRIFAEQRELVQWAKNQLEDRIRTLEKDVRHCLLEESQYAPDAPAPFPALLFCFSTIDLLGALSTGNAAKNAHPTPQSKEYMQRFMGYTNEQSELLQNLFRHKLVHLAQPKPVIKHNGQFVTWHLWHENSPKHLQKEKLLTKANIVLTSILTIECDFEFHVSIKGLVNDIRNSMQKPTGYLTLLEVTPDLQDKFEQAVSRIYDYE